MDERDCASRPTPAHLGRLLLHALRGVQNESVALLAECGHDAVRTGHLPVFSYIDTEGTRITELADRSGMSRQMMGRLVRELEAAEYVATRPDPADRRAVIVTLTDRGERFCADARAVTTEQERRYTELLGATGFDALRDALAQLAVSPHDDVG